MSNKRIRILRKIVQSPEVYIFLFGFFFNFVWEVSQIPFYAGFNNPFNSESLRFWFGTNDIATRSTFVQVFWEASLGDAFSVLVSYWIVSLITWNRNWYLEGGYLFGKRKCKISRYGGYLITMLLSVVYLVITEYLALTQGWWGYSSIMPLITPNIGLIPLLGLFITTPSAYIMTRRVFIGIPKHNNE